jgi:hypothetical protein
MMIMKDHHDNDMELAALDEIGNTHTTVADKLKKKLEL